MDVTLYKRPHGRTEVINMRNINADDEEWFRANDVRVSIEDCGTFIAIYADCGFTIDDDPDEEAEEIIVISRGQSCQDSMSELRTKCQSSINEGRERPGRRMDGEVERQ